MICWRIILSKVNYYSISDYCYLCPWFAIYLILIFMKWNNTLYNWFLNVLEFYAVRILFFVVSENEPMNAWMQECIEWFITMELNSNLLTYGPIWAHHTKVLNPFSLICNTKTNKGAILLQSELGSLNGDMFYYDACPVPFPLPGVGSD